MQSSKEVNGRGVLLLKETAAASASLRCRLRCCNLFLFLLACLSFCTMSEAQQNEYSKAQQAYATGRFREAADLFGRVSEAENTNPAIQQSDAELMQARSLMHTAEQAQAEAALRHYAQRHPASATALYLLARLLQTQNKPRESLAALTDAARLAPPAAEDLRIASLDYVLLNDYGDALQWSKRAVASDPANAEAWYDLARVQMHDGRYEDAIQALHRSLAVRPTSAKALDNLGVCLENQNRNDDALAAYGDAVRATVGANRPSALPFRDEGKLLVTRNAFAQAAPLLVRATELDATDPSTFATLATAYLGLQQTAAARTAMERAVSLDPKNPRLHYQMARIYRTVGEQALAEREFKQSAAMYGNTSAE